MALTGTIEAAAAQYSKRITKLGKEVKQTGRDWKVLDALRERVESIKKLMPLITDLRNPVRIPSRRIPRRIPRRISRRICTRRCASGTGSR